MDENGLRRPVFDVRSISWNEYDDLSKPPTDGKQYIRRVMQEAAACDEVVVADVSKLNLPNLQTFTVDSGNGLYECRTQLLPSLTLQQLQINQFGVLRQSLVRDGETELPTGSSVAVSFPGNNNVTAWHTFCFGRAGREAMTPLLNIVLSMSDITTEHLLQHHVTWLTAETEITEIAGKWCYALLAVIKIPLKPNTISTLRNMVRQCSRMRSLINRVEESMLHTYNLLICLIARYFAQLDLADG